MILRRRLLRSVLTAVVLLGGAGMTIRASSAIELFRFNLQGRYAFGWYGADLSAPPGASAFALVGVLSFDGKGAIAAHSIITYNDAGTYCEGVTTEGAKYNILPDGEGWAIFDIALTSGICPITHFEFPISISNVGGSKIARRVSMGAGGGLAANLTGSGLAALQGSDLTLSDGSLRNGYSFSWFGHDFSIMTSGNNEFGAVGAIGFKNGKILGGSIAYNDGGSICRAGGLSGVDGLSGAGLTGSYNVGAHGHVLLNLEIVGAAGTCPLTSFVISAVLSDIGSSGSANTIQFLSASAAGPGNPSSPKVVVSGTAIKVGRYVLEE